MAFEAKNLEYIGGNKVRRFGYYTDDAITDVDTSGYFSAAASSLSVGTRIDLNCSMSTTPTFGEAVVITNDGTTVDIADATGQGGTNTD